MTDPKPRHAGGRVLIVDDEGVIRETLAWIFRSRGYAPKAVGSAEEALELVDEWVPGMAIIDVSLPGMDGVDLAIHLKSLRPECRLLLISGQPGSLELLQRAESKGHVLELLAKPVPPATLLERAAQMLG